MPGKRSTVRCRPSARRGRGRRSHPSGPPGRSCATSGSPRSGCRAGWHARPATTARRGTATCAPSWTPVTSGRSRPCASSSRAIPRSRGPTGGGGGGGEGAADRLVLRKDVLVEPDALADLFRAVGWHRKANDVPRLARMLEGTTQMVSAWDGPRMVRFARAVSDQAYNGYISSVAVHPRWQGKGLGERLITALMEQNDEIKFVLTAVPGIHGFYESLGFTADPEGMVRSRRR